MTSTFVEMTLGRTEGGVKMSTDHGREPRVFDASPRRSGDTTATVEQGQGFVPSKKKTMLLGGAAGLAESLHFGAFWSVSLT
jgi:hypothetical protein